MKQDKKNGDGKKAAWQKKKDDKMTMNHSDHEIGLPEDIRVHHNGEANPHDG